MRLRECMNGKMEKWNNKRLVEWGNGRMQIGNNI
jgi:hypothetical protein